MATGEDLADWIRNTRNMKGWTTGELAKRSGLTSNAIWQYENARRTVRPDPGALARIAEALSYPPQMLWKMAGLIPTASKEEDEAADRFTLLARKLSKENLELVIEFAEFLLTKQGR